MEGEERKAVKERVKEVKESALKSLAKDSCTNTRIEDCYIVSGDDCVAVKSGRDEYGIKFEPGGVVGLLPHWGIGAVEGICVRGNWCR
ncbi:hypothetical protein HN51_044689 [Arachis hypogaea]